MNYHVYMKHYGIKIILDLRIPNMQVYIMQVYIRSILCPLSIYLVIIEFKTWFLNTKKNNLKF